MRVGADPFVFAEHSSAADEFRKRGFHVYEIPPNLGHPSELHRALARELGFPSYYGKNWNALDEMLSDLSWLPKGDMAIVHRGLPRLQGEDLTLYLRVLSDAVLNAPILGRSLAVVLPAGEEWVMTLLPEVDVDDRSVQ
jgi:hypothetical protein